MGELLFKNEAYRIIGAAIAVHKETGVGFLESCYQAATEMELLARNIPFARQQPIKISYKGRPLQKFFIADLICFSAVLVEIKAINKIGEREQSQVLNYLKATGLRVGLVINFSDPGRHDWERYVL